MIHMVCLLVPRKLIYTVELVWWPFFDHLHMYLLFLLLILLVDFLYLFVILQNTLGLFLTSFISFVFSWYKVCISLFNRSVFSTFYCLSEVRINRFSDVAFN